MTRKGAKQVVLVTQKGLFDTTEALIAYLRHAIDVEKLSQDQIAAKLGCSKQQLWRYRRLFGVEGLPYGYITGMQHSKPHTRDYEPPRPIFSWD